jgi:DNA-binding transcriptional MocR family regulator
MERELGISINTRLRLIKELLDAGLIERIHRGGRGQSYTYITSKNLFSNNGNTSQNLRSEETITSQNLGSDHLINNKNSVCAKNNARAREAHTQDSSNDAPAYNPTAFFTTHTKEAAVALRCPREVTIAFHEYWTATTSDGRQLWETKQAFNFKSRLKNWMRHEQRQLQ